MGVMDIFEEYHGAPSGEELQKAMMKEEQNKAEADEPKSAIIDPFGNTSVLGVRQKPMGVPFSTLRRMALVPAIAAIINTRLNQVACFARRPRFEGDMGFKIVLKDSDRKMSPAEKKRAHEIEEFFLKTGAVPNAKRKDNFDIFLRKLVRDTLTIDAMVWENVPNLKGNVAEMWAVDAATIELVINNPLGDDVEPPVYIPVTKRGVKIQDEIAYVQRVDGRVVAEYTEEELAYAIRNPRTELEYVDFGMSELENIMEIVTGILNGVRYNTSYFSESHLPQGVLEVVGKYKDTHFEAFKRHWKTMTQGPRGKWAVPVFAMEEGQGFKFTPFKNSNRDMEFNEFLEFLFNIACAVYQIDPNEVGFKSWTSNNSGMGGKSDNTEAKLDQSKDKGFTPLMQFIANTFNSEVIDRIDPDFAFTWIGVDDEDEERKIERDKSLLESGKVTVAELRKRDDMEEILGEDGKPAPWTLAPGNPQLIQVYMAGMQAAQQTEQGQMQGDQQLKENEQKAGFDQKTRDDTHGKQIELQKLQHQHGLEQADQTHKNSLEAQANDQKHAKDIQKDDQTHDLKGKDVDHSHTLEQSEIQHKQALEAQKNEHGHADKSQEQEHGHADKSQDKEHAHADKSQDKEHAHADKGKETDHRNTLEQASQGHRQNLEAQKTDHDHTDKRSDIDYKRAKEDKGEDRKYSSEDKKGDHKRNMEAKDSDQKHAIRVEAIRAKAKSQGGKLKKSLTAELKKSLTDEDLENLEVEIDWTDY